MKGSACLIIKPLEVPVRLLQTESLNMRLPLTHLQKEEVATQARNLRAGYNGERSLQFQLSFLPYEQHLIFYNLRIQDPQGFFQIDILLISTNFILIIEVKNIRGQINFDEMGQVIRIENEKEQAFTNPVDQVNLQHLRLLRWLRKLNIPTIPVEKLVVYSNSNTILKNLTNNREISKVVIHKEKVLDKINQFSNEHNLVRLSEEQLIDLSFQLLSAHTQENTDILKKYNVSDDELIKGVICPDCSHVPMHRKRGKWLCGYCHSSSRSAHKTAFEHYALLISKYISNRQVREFLQLDSIHIAKQLLQKENFEHFGVNSGRKYILNVDYFM